MTPIVAIDPGAWTGWAALDSAGCIHFGSWKLAPDSATVGRRLNNLSARLSELQSRFLPEMWVCEEPFIRAGVSITARPLIKYYGIVEAHCDRVGLPEPIGQDPICSKKAFGRPHGDKAEIMRIATLMGYAVQRHDEADALGHLLWRQGVMSQMSLGLVKKRKRRA